MKFVEAKRQIAIGVIVLQQGLRDLLCGRRRRLEAERPQSRHEFFARHGAILVGVPTRQHLAGHAQRRQLGVVDAGELNGDGITRRGGGLGQLHQQAVRRIHDREAQNQFGAGDLPIAADVPGLHRIRQLGDVAKGGIIDPGARDVRQGDITFPGLVIGRHQGVRPFTGRRRGRIRRSRGRGWGLREAGRVRRPCGPARSRGRIDRGGRRGRDALQLVKGDLMVPIPVEGGQHFRRLILAHCVILRERRIERAGEDRRPHARRTKTRGFSGSLLAAQLFFTLHHRKDLLELLIGDLAIGVGVEFLEGGARRVIPVGRGGSQRVDKIYCKIRHLRLHLRSPQQISCRI